MVTDFAATSDLFLLHDRLCIVVEDSPRTQHTSGDSDLTADIKYKDGHHRQMATLERPKDIQPLRSSDCEKRAHACVRRTHLRPGLRDTLTRGLKAGRSEGSRMVSRGDGQTRGDLSPKGLGLYWKKLWKLLANRIPPLGAFIISVASPNPTSNYA
ncbi:hypothetical protein CABS01_16984 [Colletotrichum abscissum]|uniref:uncharacterized protein n=1 Tax=Colletotrichum abscissum TaxID=1671311 RepID=UPI0027D6BFEB|nr:uncharacterized protein CABS01_16984 [Colletotrichum abscissum]KAK1501452.1 hypothetical protein CABS01_16984 [Colletotrichum abscissum]